MGKKIKSVKRNGIPYKRIAGNSNMWTSSVSIEDALCEWIHEDVIRNCPLFEIEYEESDPEIEELKKQLQYCIEGLEKIAAKYGGNK